MRPSRLSASLEPTSIPMLARRSVLCLGLLAAGCGDDPASAAIGGGAASIASALAGEPGPGPCYKRAPRKECGIAEPATFEMMTHHAPCRLPEFGLETWWIQNEVPYETAEHTMAGDQCTGFLNVWGPAHFFREKHQECMDVMTDFARANLGAHARVECITPEVSQCTHDGPRSTRFRYRYRVQILLPQWKLHLNDPRCPQVGPTERREISPARFHSCCHELNGLADDPAECQEAAS